MTARARVLYPQIEFTDDRDGCQFRALVRRPGIKTPQATGAPKLTARQAQVRSLIAEDCRITIRKLAQCLGIHTSAVQAHIEALRRKGVLDRTGGTHGRWVVGE